MLKDNAAMTPAALGRSRTNWTRNDDMAKKQGL